MSMNVGMMFITAIKHLPFKARAALLLCIVLILFEILSGLTELHIGRQDNPEIPWTWKETIIDVPADISTDLKIRTDSVSEQFKNHAEVAERLDDVAIKDKTIDQQKDLRPKHDKSKLRNNTIMALS